MIKFHWSSQTEYNSTDKISNRPETRFHGIPGFREHTNVVWSISAQDYFEGCGAYMVDLSLCHQFT